VVEEQEGVGLGEGQLAREGPADNEPGALGLTVRRHDLGDRTRPGHRRVRPGDAGQDEGVLNRDGRHGDRS
jgi:hypothetical protein